MGYGMEIKNAQGKEIQYGAEAIPCCIAAFEAQVPVGTVPSQRGEDNISGYHTKVLDYPFQPDVMVFVRVKTGEATPTAFTANINGRLGIRYLAFSSGPSPMPLNAGVARFYIVSRIPETTDISGSNGVAIWGSDGKLSFYSNMPPAPIKKIETRSASSKPYIGKRSAMIPVYSGDAITGETQLGGLRIYVYTRYGCTIRNGHVYHGITSHLAIPITPGSGWGRSVRYKIIAMDTNEADHYFFGGSL